MSNQSNSDVKITNLKVDLLTANASLLKRFINKGNDLGTLAEGLLDKGKTSKWGDETITFSFSKEDYNKIRDIFDQLKSDNFMSTQSDKYYIKDVERLLYNEELLKKL